eukprot:4453664-Karenia_brevis.AAC.1
MGREVSKRDGEGRSHSTPLPYTACGCRCSFHEGDVTPCCRVPRVSVFLLWHRFSFGRVPQEVAA